MGVIDDLRRGIEYPHLFIRELNKYYYTKMGYWDYNVNGFSVTDAEWDNLIVLDACRYDVFQEVDLRGETEARISRAGETPEFIKANFTGKQLHDTIVVTGNGWYLNLQEKYDYEFFDIYFPGNVRESEKQRKITERAIEYANKYPNKRLLVHYIPPHHPYIGETASEHFPPFEEQSSDFFSRFRHDEWGISDSQLKKAYHENLQRAIPFVDELLETLGGRSVVTADHGEFLGERTWPIPIKEYGHFSGLYQDELVKVPWHIHDNGERRTIQSDDPNEYSYDEEDIEQRLKELGYR